MNRRDFLAAGATLTIGGPFLLAQPPAPAFPAVATGYDIPIPPQPAVKVVAGEAVTTPNELLDLLAIQRLQMTYAQLHEHGTADEIAALFHPKAELYALYLEGKGFRGREQIRDWYAWWLDRYATIGDYYRHKPMNQVIDLDTDRATTNAVLVAEAALMDKPLWTYLVGRYVHEVIRTDAGWQFHKSWIILHGGTRYPGRVATPTSVWEPTAPPRHEPK